VIVVGNILRLIATFARAADSGDGNMNSSSASVRRRQREICALSAVQPGFSGPDDH
jgi:hypothetical protein